METNIQDRFTNYFGTEPEHISHFRRMMMGIANSVPTFHVKFECSGSGGGCADPDARRRLVESSFHDLTNEQFC